MDRMMGTGTILLIEDEEDLIEVLSEVIEKLGYRAVAARTGTEAIALARRLGSDIDCALLDIVLPDDLLKASLKISMGDSVGKES
jgi:two-component system cell cycle sensor histidine kinase/response regulator CckA